MREVMSKESCYICGKDAKDSEQIIIEDGIPLRICNECGGNSCSPYTLEEVGNEN